MYADAANGEATTVVGDATPSPTVGAAECEEWEEDATDGGCLFGDGDIADAAVVAATAACDDEVGGGGGGRGGGGDGGGGDGDGSCGASPMAGLCFDEPEDMGSALCRALLEEADDTY